MTINMGKWYWHVHHDTLVERLIAPVQERIVFIMKNKPKDEIETRLRLLKPVKDQKTMTAARKVYVKAITAAGKAYDEATTPAWKAHDEAVTAAWKATTAAWKATTAAWKAYDEATTPAWKAHDEAVTAAWKAYDEATTPARKAYDEAVTAAWKAYDEAMKRLHKKECHDCPWDGQTIFPSLSLARFFVW